MKAPKIFFSVGEPSGDQHAAPLIDELRRRRPDIEFEGFGGPLMERAGCRLLYRLTDLAVMGLFAVLPLLGKFLRLLGVARRHFAEDRPDAVVLVDFPGFNWQIAKRAKAAGIPVFYYLPPQLWAWAPWRIRRVRKWVDCVLSGLTFEHRWYTERGVAAEYVGHPFFDEVAAHPLDAGFLTQWKSTADGPVVGILPGSRSGEIAQNWPIMLRVVRELSARHPDADLKFLVAGYKPEHVARCREMLSAADDDLPLHFFTGKTSEVIEAADCCLMVSGSVSLELLARATPAAVVYRIRRIENFLKRLILLVKYITLPNLMAGRELFPEWVLSGDTRTGEEEIIATLDGWLGDPRKLAAKRAELESLRAEVVQTGATARTAEAILSRLRAAADPLPEPARRAA